MDSTRPRIAIIIPGGIGTGHDNIGVPVLERMVRKLAITFDVTVFQLFEVNKGYQAAGFELVAISSSFAWLRMLKTLWAFYRRHHKRNYVAVHGFWILPAGFLAVLIGKIFRLPSIVSVLGGDAARIPSINYGQLLKPYYRMFSRLTVRHAGETMLLTQYLLDSLAQNGIVPSRASIVPWGVDADVFTFRKKPLASPVRVLHVANLYPIKDQATLLRTFKIISDSRPAHLTIIGVGVLEGEIKMLAGALGLAERITFLNLQPYESLVHFYHQADVLLHTSIAEGQSEVVTEAMSCGVPVCGTNVGALYDLHGACAAVPVGDYAALAAATLQLLDSPERMHAMIQRAHAWATQHSLDWTVQQTATRYYNAARRSTT